MDVQEAVDAIGRQLTLAGGGDGGAGGDDHDGLHSGDAGDRRPRARERKGVAEAVGRDLALDLSLLDDQAAIGLAVPFAEQVRGDEHGPALGGDAAQVRLQRLAPVRDRG